MTLGQGGHIEQTIVKDLSPPGYFDMEHALLWNVQLLGAKTAKALFGKNAALTPMTAKEYEAAGGAFFSIKGEQKSGVSGAFEEVFSVAQMDASKGLVEKAKEMAKSAKFRVVVLDVDGMSV